MCSKVFYCGQIEGTFGCCGAVFHKVSVLLCFTTVVLRAVFSKQQCYSCHGASRQVSPAGQSIEAWNGRVGFSCLNWQGGGFLAWNGRGGVSLPGMAG